MYDYENIRSCFGSKLDSFEGLNTKQGDGGRRYGRCTTYGLEKTEGRGQFHHGQPGCLPDDRYGDNDQGGGFNDYRRKERLPGAQVCQKPVRTYGLEHMLSCKLLWMLLQDACCGGPHDERHQRRNSGGDWRLESESSLETGKHTAEDRAHRRFPRDQTDAEKDAEQTRS
eukprot:7062188-Heterocapsa_arctica.AAC.1